MFLVMRRGFSKACKLLGEGKGFFKDTYVTWWEQGIPQRHERYLVGAGDSSKARTLHGGRRGFLQTHLYAACGELS